MKGTSRHHVSFDRLSHTARKESAFIRSSIVPLMYDEPHVELHKHSPVVPVLAYYALSKVVRLFEPHGTTMERIESLQHSIDEVIKNPRMHPVERGIGDLAIWALDVQKPFIIDGEVRDR